MRGDKKVKIMQEFRKGQNNIEIPEKYKDLRGLIKCLFQSVLDVDKGYIYYHKKMVGSILKRNVSSHMNYIDAGQRESKNSFVGNI